jgi:hypothetical protein
MALQGNLKDFSITEIVQLIGQQLKTGVLKVRRGRDRVELSFVDGMIVHVYSSYRGKKDLIGEIFVKAQLITQEQLDRVLRIQKETFKYLGEILVELQLLTKEDVFKVVSNQVYETIYDLFWWEEGEFNFDLKMVESYKKIPFALSTEQVLLNILRMVDEWSEIEKKIFSPHLVFRKGQGAGEKAGESLPMAHAFQEGLTSEQELLYNLADGNRTVQEIVARSLLGKFNASEILVDLLDAGLVEIAGIRTPSLVKKVGTLNFRGALPFTYYGGVLLCIALLLSSFDPDVLQFLWDSKIEEVKIQIPARLAHKRQLERVKNALEIYYLEKGSYPPHLDELVSARLLGKEDLFYRKGLSYQYELEEGKYLLKH